MFIKFSDKTKNIMVKKGSKDEVDGYAEENSIFLDSEDKDDRRLKARRESIEQEKADDK